MRRVYLGELNLRLKGYPPDAARRLADELPAALAYALEHPNAAPRGLAGEVASRVVACLSHRREGDA